MAEAAKRRGEQLKQCEYKCGDNVSVPGNYFFTDMPTFPSITGTIVKILGGGCSLRVKWDADRSESDVNLNDIIKNVITSADYQNPETGTSTEAAITHALIEECDIPDDVDDIIPDDVDECCSDTYTLLNGKNKLFMGKHIPTKPDELVHNIPIKENEGKFEIVKVFGEAAQQWDDYDEDLHCIGSYVVWRMKSVIGSKSSSSKKKVNNKTRKRKKFELRIKARKRKTIESEESESEVADQVIKEAKRKRETKSMKKIEKRRKKSLNTKKIKKVSTRKGKEEEGVDKDEDEDEEDVLDMEYDEGESESVKVKWQRKEKIRERKS